MERGDVNSEKLAKEVIDFLLNRKGFAHWWQCEITMMGKQQILNAIQLFIERDNQSLRTELSKARQIKELEQSHEGLVDALQILFKMMDDQDLVRNTSGDAEGGWAIKALKFTSKLKMAHDALTTAQALRKEL